MRSKRHFRDTMKNVFKEMLQNEATGESLGIFYMNTDGVPSLTEVFLLSMWWVLDISFFTVSKRSYVWSQIQ